MLVTVRLFAVLRDRAGAGELSLELPDGATAGGAVERLGERFPSLHDLLPRTAVAVNQEYAPRSAVLNDRDELALIPPVSGG